MYWTPSEGRLIPFGEFRFTRFAGRRDMYFSREKNSAPKIILVMNTENLQSIV